MIDTDPHCSTAAASCRSWRTSTPFRAKASTRANPPISSVWADATWAVAGATPNIRGIPAATRPSTCRWSSTVRWPVLPCAIVITGGEPLLYPLDILTRTLHDRGLQIFLETSGTHPISGRFDWVCLSPKRQQPPLDEAFRRAHELKVIVEREDDLQWAEQNAARVGDDCLLYLQPEWSVYERMMPLLVEYAKAHPQWNISIQTHKFMHIP